MARPKKNNAEYFSHDADMRNDVKIKALRRKFSHKGFAVWCFLLETLTDNDFFTIEWEDISIELLAADYEVSPEELTEIVDYCVKIDLLQREEGKIYSASHQKRFAQLLANRERKRGNDNQPPAETPIPSDNGEVSASQNTAEIPSDDSNGNPKTHSKVKYSKVKESKGEDILTHTHTKNDLRGVQGGNEEAARFLDWIDRTFPDIAGMVEPLTIDDADWLVRRYDEDLLKTIIASMHNNDVSGKLGIRPPTKVKVRAITTIRSYIANAKKSN